MSDDYAGKQTAYAVQALHKTTLVNVKSCARHTELGDTTPCHSEALYSDSQSSLYSLSTGLSSHTNNNDNIYAS